MQGYIIGKHWNQDIVEQPLVRYARQMSDGSLFAAFEETDRASVDGLRVYGDIYVLFEDLPPEWWKRDYPKRGAIFEDERFTLLRPTKASAIETLRIYCEMKSVREAGIVIDPSGMVLILVTTAREDRYAPAVWTADVKVREEVLV